MLIPRFLYPGIDSRLVTSATYSLSHGITPGVITVEVPANSPVPNMEGTAAFSVGNVTVPIMGCKLDVGASSMAGGPVWTFSIQDFRWRWQYGTISGHYNLRLADGSLRPETEETPRQLATKCLREMRVQSFDVSEMPDEPRPECHWSYAVPAQALARLADDVGCRVVVSTRGEVKILPAGFGANLPDGPTVDYGFSVDTGALPSAVLIVGGPAYFQARWRLIAVGRDVDGTIKPIDELSYTPSGGWAKQVPGHLTDVEEGTDPQKPDPRKLALQTVFRWYRIESMEGGDDLPGLRNVRVDSWKDCLPIENGVLDMFRDENTKQLERQPPVVRGTFLDEEFTYAEVVNGQFRGEFSVMGEAGVISFARPMYRLNNGETSPAELTVEIAFPYHEKLKEEPYRPTWRYPVRPRADVGDFPLIREEIKFTARWEYDSNGNRTTARDNRRDDNLDDQAQYAAATFVQSLGNVNAASRGYSGFLDVRPDGALQQISWSFGVGQFPTTRVSRNCEHDSDIFPPYAQRRRAEQTRQLIADIRRMSTGKPSGMTW